MNLYAYVGNSPINLADPSGLIASEASLYAGNISNQFRETARALNDAAGRNDALKINLLPAQNFIDDVATGNKGGIAFAVISSLNPGGKIVSAVSNSSQILSWGKNSIGHLIKHRDALGLGHVSAQQAQKLASQLRGSANQLLNAANPALTRAGQWHQHQNAIMYISNGKMLVTEANGTFITVINKTSNNWYQLGKPLR
jgi:hypothetical protein